MHVDDGVLPLATLALGGGCALALTAATLPALSRASPPRVAMATAAFFVSSLLSFRMLGTSVHLSLLGVAGVVLGRAAFPAVLVGLALQLLLLGHGGLTTLGVNATTMGGGALVAAALYHAGRRASALRAGLAAAAGMSSALAAYGLALLSAGEAFERVAWVCVLLHTPVVLVEGAMTAALVSFLARVEPGLVTPGGGATPAPEPASASAPEPGP